MIKITRFIYISAFCLPLFIVAYFTDSIHTLLLSYSVCAVHEIFHLLCACALSVKVKSIIIMPFGITMRLSDSVIKNTSKEIMIALCGPFANVLMMCIGVVFGKLYASGGANLFLFIYLNLIMLFVNLLPCMPLDGGRILKAFLVGRIGYLNTVSVQRRLERIVIAALGVLGILLVFVTKFNISLVMIAAFLAFNMVSEDKKKNYIMMNELIHHREKLKERKYMQTKCLTARGDVLAGDIMRRFSYDSFYVVNVADSDLSVACTLSEGEIISSLEKFGFCISLEDIMMQKAKQGEDKITFDSTLC